MIRLKYGKLSHNSEMGTMGDSTLATEEKGQLLMQRAVDRIVLFLRESWSLPEKEQEG